MQFYHDLGSQIEIRWREKNYEDSVFPEIASDALAEMDALKGPSPWDMICTLHQNLGLPAQRDDKFSDLVVTLYNAPRFHIAAYYWLDGTTSLHQHSFSGAFQVLLGSSLHSRYSFRETHVINPHMSAGDIILDHVQLLKKGDISKILPGRQFIHSLFHLDRPSVTLTIRTNGNINVLPQYDYLPPSLAIDPFYEDSVTSRQIQSIKLLIRMRHQKVDSFVDQLVRSMDFQTTFSILNVIYQFFSNTDDRAFLSEKGQERFNKLIDTARKKHGSLIDLLPPVFEELQRKVRLNEQRKIVVSNEHRYFLALLLNVPDKTRLLQLVEERLPGKDPVDIVCDWVQQLSALKLPGSIEPNIVGIADFDSLYLTVFRYSLQGLSLDQIERKLQEERVIEKIKELWGSIEKMRNEMENTNLLKTLLREPRVATISNLAAIA
jgi:hypothetical protein